MNYKSARFQSSTPKQCREITRTKVKKIADAASPPPTRLSANSQTQFATNSQCYEFHGEFPANSQSERIRSEFAKFESNSLRICIPSAPGFAGGLRGAPGGRPRTGLMVPAAGPCRSRGAGLAPRCTRLRPPCGVVPGGFHPVLVAGCMRCSRLGFADPVTHASVFLCCPPFHGVLGQCTGAVSCGCRHLPILVGACNARVPCADA